MLCIFRYLSVTAKDFGCFCYSFMSCAWKMYDSETLFLIYSQLCFTELGFCDIQFWSYLYCFWFL